MRRLLLTLIVLFFAAGPLARAAHADDRSDALRERIEMIRRLPPEEQQRLREALRRFQSLPETRRHEVRQAADRIGKERLRELVGRDVGHLRRRREALDRERAEIVRLLGGEERFAALDDVEQSYIESLAVRSFQKHVRRTLLAIAGPNEMNAFSRLPRDERKARLEDAVEQLETNLLAAETPQSRAAILALPPREQKRERRRLLAEHRLSLVSSFVTAFERQRVRPFLLMPDEERRRAAEHWEQRARWFEMKRRLDKDVGISRETLRLLARLGPEDWARLRDEYDRTQELSDVERRLQLEKEIRELYGRAALSGESDRRERAGRGRRKWRSRDELRWMMRAERRQRHRDSRDPEEH